MASFCSRCGSALPSETGFCPACGAAVGAAVSAPGFAPVPVPPAVPAQTASAPPPAPPYGGQPASGYGAPYAGGAAPGVQGYPAATAYPAAASGGGGALKIVLIVLAVVVGLGIIAASVVGYTVWHVARAVKVDNKEGTASITVPGGGSFSVGDSTGTTDAELEVPVYPGARREKGGMNLNSGSTSMVMAHFSTTDAPEKVVEFYKGKMGDQTVSVVSGDNDGTVLQSGSKDTDHVMVTVNAGRGNDDGKTTILVMHTRKK